jgi:hypothetical protein
METSSSDSPTTRPPLNSSPNRFGPIALICGQTAHIGHALSSSVRSGVNPSNFNCSFVILSNADDASPFLSTKQICHANVAPQIPSQINANQPNETK